jgi:hypothetical protein
MLGLGNDALTKIAASTFLLLTRLKWERSARLFGSFENPTLDRQKEYYDKWCANQLDAESRAENQKK